MAPRLTRAHTAPLPTQAAVQPEEPNRSVAVVGKYTNNIADGSETDCENFAIAMVRPLVMYGASLDMIEDQLLEIARHFNIKVTVFRRPGHLICVLGEYGNERRKIKISDSGRREPNPLGLVEAHNIISAVIDGEVRMSEGVDILNHMEKRDPLSRPFRHVACAAILSAYICMRVFDGSLKEVVYTFGITHLLCVLQLFCTRAGRLPADFLEASIVVAVSLFAHDSHAQGNIIIGILPGYLHLCNMIKTTKIGGGTSIEGYIRTAFAIVYALSLKFGLPILLDVVLVARLFTLVVLGKHVFGKSTKTKRTIVRVGKVATPTDESIEKVLAEATTIDE